MRDGPTARRIERFSSVQCALGAAQSIAATTVATRAASASDRLLAPPMIGSLPGTHMPQQSLHCVGLSLFVFFGARNTWPLGQSAALLGLPSHEMPAHLGWHDRQLRGSAS